MKLTKFLRTPFLQNISTLVAASGSKQCKPMKAYTENLCCRERLVFLDKEYSSEVFQTLLAVTHLSKVAGENQKQSSRVRKFNKGALKKSCS